MAYVTTPDGVGIFYQNWVSGPPVMFHHVEHNRPMGAALRHGVEQ